MNPPQQPKRGHAAPPSARNVTSETPLSRIRCAQPRPSAGTSARLLCRGTNTPIEEVAADALIADDYDFGDMASIETTERRAGRNQRV